MDPRTAGGWQPWGVSVKSTLQFVVEVNPDFDRFMPLDKTGYRERQKPFVVEIRSDSGDLLTSYAADSAEAASVMVEDLRRELVECGGLGTFLEQHGVPTHKIRKLMRDST
jgi:hypothetical protein